MLDEKQSWALRLRGKHMIGSAILLLGSYWAISTGIDMFVYPKLLAVFVGAFLCQGQWVRHEDKIGPLVAGVLGTSILSGALSSSPLQSLFGFYRGATMGLLGVCAAVMAWDAGLRCSTKDWKFITWGAFFGALVALSQFSPGALFHELLPSGRVIGLAGSPPYLGCMLALAVPVAWLGAPISLVAIVAALLATQSKAAILGAIAGAWVFADMRYAHKIKPWIRHTAAGVGILGAFGALNRGVSDLTRLEIWKTAWRAFHERPLFGWGPDNFVDAFTALRSRTWIEAAEHSGVLVAENAHNLILHILVTRGFIGLVLSGLLAARVYRTLRDRHLWFEEPEPAACLASCAAVLVYSMFNPVPFTAWCVLGFMLGSLGI